MDGCLVCARLAAAREGRNPDVILELERTVLVLGDHQYFKGYCVLLYKDHAREPHELAPGDQRKLFEELMRAGRAVSKAFRPWKLNYSCYGNQVPHVHWHLFPRYEADPERFSPPWTQSARFKDAPGTPEERRAAVEALRAAMKEGV